MSRKRDAADNRWIVVRCDDHPYDVALRLRAKGIYESREAAEAEVLRLTEESEVRAAARGSEPPDSRYLILGGYMVEPGMERSDRPA